MHYRGSYRCAGDDLRTLLARVYALEALLADIEAARWQSGVLLANVVRVRLCLKQLRYCAACMRLRIARWCKCKIKWKSASGSCPPGMSCLSLDGLPAGCLHNGSA